MKTTIDFLDEVKAKHGLPSDYALSKFFGCTKSSISNYRMKKNHFDDEMAVKVAKALDVSPGYILNCVAAERAKSDTTRKAWERAAKHLGGMAASLVIVAGLGFGGFSELNQQFEAVKQVSFSTNQVYILGNSLLAALLAIMSIIPRFQRGNRES